MFFSILLNLAFLMVDKYPIEIDKIKNCEYLNIVFTVIAIFEVCTKIIAYGLKTYFKSSNFNIFDFLIMIFSLVDVLLIRFVFFEDSFLINSSVITVLRALRIIRLFKLARFWHDF